MGASNQRDYVKFTENLEKNGNFGQKTSFLNHLQFPQLFETIFFGFPAFFCVDLSYFLIFLVKF